MVLAKHILAAVAALVLTRAVRADMVPLSDRDFGSRCTILLTSDCPPQSVPDDSVPFSCLVWVGLDQMPVGPFVDAQAGVEHADASQPVCILADKQDSLGLSLCALLFVGLCKAAPYLKALSAVALPACWYDGSRSEIGHRLNLSPGDLHPACGCFLPPGWQTEGSLPQYRQEAVAASWRDSQFTSTTRSGRGPPLFGL